MEHHLSPQNTAPVNSPSTEVPPGIADTIISIDATSLLPAYQANEKTAIARYENKKLEVTGELSGVFIPRPQGLDECGAGLSS